MTKEDNMTNVQDTFHKITIEDKAWMNEKFAVDDRNFNEYAFSTQFIWSDVFKTNVGKIYDCLVTRFIDKGQYKYTFPIGEGDKKKVIEFLLEASQKDNIKLKLGPLSINDKEKLQEWFPDKFLIEENRDIFDYIYTTEKLTTLKGKKLSSKRNHINRFKDNGDWSYEKLTINNIDECKQMAQKWVQLREDKWNKEMEKELSVLYKAFDNFTQLDLTGGILRKDNEIVAFTIGERLNSNTFVVHFEKAFPNVQGAYPMINQQFVEHECQDYTYINREEDTGDLGLRKAKLSYYPDILLEKYVAIEND